MKRIAEAQEARDAVGVEQRIRHHAGNAPAHGFAAYDQRAIGWAKIIHSGKVFRHDGFRLGRGLLPRRRSAARHIAELKARHAKTLCGQDLCGRIHRGGVHRGAGAMREQ
ncbi:hypothetical protein JP75_01355 [Devosia riboflavina]|uniref:Uncharacterized protein n=1 Tax=Devosia riboflavina TaxID=46914 RepID=A0A087M7G6_9HYPH|nr:hypothetical protein JP75_01355 [Devosia riboflavina]